MQWYRLNNTKLVQKAMAGFASGKVLVRNKYDNW